MREIKGDNSYLYQQNNYKSSKYIKFNIKKIQGKILLCKRMLKKYPMENNMYRVKK